MMSDGRAQSFDCKVKKKKTFKQDEDLFFNRKDTLTFSQNSAFLWQLYFCLISDIFIS